DQDATPQACVTREIDDVVGSACSASHVLGQHANVRVVADYDWSHIVEALPQQRAERDVAPAEGGSGVQIAVRASNQGADGDANRDGAPVCGNHALELDDQAGRIVEGGAHGQQRSAARFAYISTL